MAIKKGTTRPNQRAVRFTWMDKRLREGVQDLIRLYYVMKENKEPFIPVMEGFLKRVTGQDFQYDKEYAKEQQESGNLPKGNYFYFFGEHSRIIFSDNQRELFIEIMDGLQNEIKDGVVYHFYPEKWVLKSELFLESTHPAASLREHFKGNASVPDKLINKQAIETLRKQQPQIQEYSLNGKDWKRAKGIKKKVRISSTPYRVSDMQPTTPFGIYFLKVESLCDLERKLYGKTAPDLLDMPREGNYGEIPSITFDGWDNFLQVAQSLLVNYHIVLGSYERIKVCEQCKKLCFEKRTGALSFCSTLCRVKFNRESEPAERYRCRNRQNSWIRGQILKVKKKLVKLRRKGIDIPMYRPQPDHVLKSECEGCGKYLKTGGCTVLRKKNKKVLSVA